MNKAEADLKKSIILTPQEPNSYNALGLLFTEQGKYQEALDALDQAIQLVPREAFFYNNRGYCYLKQGNLLSAERDIQKSLSMNPDNAWAIRNQGWLLFQKGEKELAIDELEKSLQMQEDLELAHFYLGEVHRELGNIEKACHYYRNALRLNTPGAQDAVNKNC